MRLTRIPHVSAHICATLLRDYGVRHIVLSPGSRNAPLAGAFRESDFFKIHTVVDERFAAFAALGIATVTAEPVALCCTSGTAMLNYAPALAEAERRQVPLIAISADRPVEFMDRNESQTIRQARTLDAIVRKSVDIPDVLSVDVTTTSHCSTLINEALSSSLRLPKGPVHINMQFRPPLTCSPQEIAMPRIRRVRTFSATQRLSATDVNELADRMASSNVLIVAGTMPPDNKTIRWAQRIAEIDSCAFMAEHSSNLHGGNIISGIGRIMGRISRDILMSLKPDIVITMGAPLISGDMKDFLRRSGAEHWNLGPSPSLQDTFGALSVDIRLSPAVVLQSLYQAMKRREISSTYKRQWKELDTRILRSMEQADFPFSDFTAVSRILQADIRNFNLFISNGTAIRYAEFLPHPDVHAVYANRGASGIDGTTATAIGISSASALPLLLITGDMSLRYDLGFLTSPLCRDNLKIVVLCNRGGGIFRVIPTTVGLPSLENDFCVTHDIPESFVPMASAAGWSCFHASDSRELDNLLPAFLNSPGKALLEIVTDTETDIEVFKKIHKPI